MAVFRIILFFLFFHLVFESAGSIEIFGVILQIKDPVSLASTGLDLIVYMALREVLWIVEITILIEALLYHF